MDDQRTYRTVGGMLIELYKKFLIAGLWFVGAMMAYAGVLEMFTKDERLFGVVFFCLSAISLFFAWVAGRNK